MKKFSLYLSFAVFTICCVMPAFAEDGVLDMKQYTCQNLKLALEQDKEKDLDVLLFWLNGFVSAVQEESVPLTEEWTEEMRVKAVEFCEKQPSANMFEVAKAITRP